MSLSVAFLKFPSHKPFVIELGTWTNASPFIFCLIILFSIKLTKILSISSAIKWRDKSVFNVLSWFNPINSIRCSGIFLFSNSLWTNSKKSFKLPLYVSVTGSYS